MQALAELGRARRRRPGADRRARAPPQHPGPVPRAALRHPAPAGVLGSQRGVKGGYTFARPAGAITVLEIVELLDGPLGRDADGIFGEAVAAARAVLAATTSPTSSSAKRARPASRCTTSDDAGGQVFGTRHRRHGVKRTTQRAGDVWSAEGIAASRCTRPGTGRRRRCPRRASIATALSTVTGHANAITLHRYGRPCPVTRPKRQRCSAHNSMRPRQAMPCDRSHPARVRSA